MAFKLVEWETNPVGDSTCDSLFKNTFATKKLKKNEKSLISKGVPKFKKKRTKQKHKSLKNGISATLRDSHAKSNINLIEKTPKQRNSKEGDQRVQFTNKNASNFDQKIEKTVQSKLKLNNKKRLAKNELSSEKDVNPKSQKSDIYDETNFKDRKKEKWRQKLKQTLTSGEKSTPRSKDLPLRERMMRKLKAARFRYLNEQIYSNDGKEAQKYFTNDPDAFRAYHDGYRQQVSLWSINPVDVIIKSIKKMPKSHVVADFGCGEAKLATSVEQTVHSFDLVAVNDAVTACDMAHVPLKASSVDVVVFCLSLMGTNLNDYLLEANRVLKIGGIMKIAEVESRFGQVKDFIEGLKRYNFHNTAKDLTNNLFYFLDFRKENNIKQKKKLPTISLLPCLYKKR